MRNGLTDILPSNNPINPLPVNPSTKETVKQNSGCDVKLWIELTMWPDLFVLDFMDQFTLKKMIGLCQLIAES